MSAVLLRLVIDEKQARKGFEDYAGDCAWYRDNDKLDPHHADKGYRTGDAGTYEEYLAGWIDGIVDEVAVAHFGYSIERFEQAVALSGEATPPDKETET